MKHWHVATVCGAREAHPHKSLSFASIQTAREAVVEFEKRVLSDNITWTIVECSDENC